MPLEAFLLLPAQRLPTYKRALKVTIMSERGSVATVWWSLTLELWFGVVVHRRCASTQNRTTLTGRTCKGPST
jgi:hypothetical protein